MITITEKIQQYEYNSLLTKITITIITICNKNNNNNNTRKINQQIKNTELGL
jgi:hypothetical protein